MDNNAIDLNTLSATLLARVEATNILTNITNAILNVTQKSNRPISDEILNAIQIAFEKENTATNECLTKLEQLTQSMNSDNIDIFKSKD